MIDSSVIQASVYAGCFLCGQKKDPCGPDESRYPDMMVKRLHRPGANEPCWCGSGKNYADCHRAYDDKILELKKLKKRVPRRDMIKNPAQIAGIKESARINIAVLDYVAEHIKAGMSTGDIDRMVYEKTTEMGGIPAPLNYEGFPKSVCTSINDQVCHGIPADDIILRDGDIINVDCSTIFNGYFSDSSRMFLIGEVAPHAKKLVEVTWEAIQEGLKQVKPWGQLGDMGQAINDYAKAHGYSVVAEVGGHGVGVKFHEDPYVSYVTRKGTGMVMAPGMMFTIEPMINEGRADIFIDAENDWTIYTDDGSLSAQWELQVLITEDGYEIIAY